MLKSTEAAPLQGRWVSTSCWKSSYWTNSVQVLAFCPEIAFISEDNFREERKRMWVWVCGCVKEEGVGYFLCVFYSSASWDGSFQWAHPDNPRQEGFSGWCTGYRDYYLQLAGKEIKGSAETWSKLVFANDKSGLKLKTRSPSLWQHPSCLHRAALSYLYLFGSKISLVK